MYFTHLSFSYTSPASLYWRCPTWIPHPPWSWGKGGLCQCQWALFGPVKCELLSCLVLFIYFPVVQDLDTLSSPGDRWVYKMEDASAKWPRLGLMEGHAQFPGNFQSCLEIKTGDERIGEGKHCMMLGEPFDPSSGLMSTEVLKRQIEGDNDD